MKNTNTGRKLFNLRGFLVLTATLSGFGLPITGLFNHLYQTEPLISVTRHAWMAAHWILGLIFTIATVSHAFLNRRVLFKYIRGTVSHLGIGRETVGAVTLLIIMLIFAVGHSLVKNY